MIKILERQKMLDKIINKKNPIEVSERFTSNVSWLITEVAELANEDAWFKYFKDEKQVKRRYEEASDCLHLFASIANQLKISMDDPEIDYVEVNLVNKSKYYKETLRYLTNIDYEDYESNRVIFFKAAFNSYIKFLTSMGMEFDYVKKCFNDSYFSNLAQLL